MKLQQLLNETDFEMTLPQVKAFFLGVLCADKPMPFPKAIEELLAEFPDARPVLEGELKKLWDELQSKRQAELADMFPKTTDLTQFLEISKEQLDYFLTAMSLSGTNVETSDNDEMVGVIDELEEIVMDMDEYLAMDKPAPEEGEEIKEFLLETWNDFIEAKQ